MKKNIEKKKWRITVFIASEKLRVKRAVTLAEKLREIETHSRAIYIGMFSGVFSAGQKIALKLHIHRTTLSRQSVSAHAY